MALYKIDKTGEAIQVDRDEYTKWCGTLRGEPVVLARHDIIEHKQLGALALDTMKQGKYHRGKVISTVVTRLVSNTYSLVNNDEYQTPPWETNILGDDPDCAYRSSTTAQAREAHKLVVNLELKRCGGRLLI
jgi:hypothetical protein